jgi:transcriptional regulator with XRE-family HTH domain
MASDAELGRYIAVLRERAGLKQVDLAKRMPWSQAVLSRIEAGERNITDDDLQAVIDGIGTKEARDLRDILGRHWEVIPEPPLGHGDQELLWAADSLAKELKELRERPEVKHVFGRRISEYLEELSRAATSVMTQNYEGAFIGSIGVGKSTSICRLTGLEIVDEPGQPSIPVLESGGGGVTLCEVHLRQGPDYGLLIEPRSEEEIRRDVLDFAEFFVKTKDSDVADESEAADTESPGLSKEVARAVRNMSGLKKRKEKSASGKTIWHDEAKNLAQGYSDPHTFAVEILARMQLHSRERRDIWYSQTTGKPALRWLQETFALINNGRHPEFSLPKRIEVIVKEPILGIDGLNIRLIDTKGIDQTAERADLEGHFDAPYTVTLLCTGFNNAPATEIQLLLKRAGEAGIRNLPLKAAILVLPHPGQALAVKDDVDGVSAKTAEEGYDLKRDQIEMQLQRLGLEEMPVGFFNAREDSPELFASFLKERIEKLQEHYRNRLADVVQSARNLIANYEKEQVQEVVREVAHRLLVWVEHNGALGRVNATVHDSLLSALGKAYASTIRATVNRDGGWQNLDYGHHLGFGARRIAAMAAEKKLESFKAITANVLDDPELAEAKDLIEQTERVLQTTIDELLRKVQIMGQSIYLNILKEDQEFWRACQGEWGLGKVQGRGYRDRVSGRNREWFDEDAHARYEELVRNLLEKEWAQALERLAALCRADAEETA